MLNINSKLLAPLLKATKGTVTSSTYMAFIKGTYFALGSKLFVGITFT
jgi:hypothetical protein